VDTFFQVIALNSVGHATDASFFGYVYE